MDERAVSAVAALADPVRAALYGFARRSQAPVTREDAARAVGISRKLAAFHLDKLVACGLLHTATATAGTPRVGRAPKRYAPTEGVSVQVPQREHALLAGILLDAVTGSQGCPAAAEAARRQARERGRALGSAEHERLRPGRLGAERAMGLAEQVLDHQGYEPAREPATPVAPVVAVPVAPVGAVPQCLRMRNCPFHPLAEQSPGLVCGLNHEFVSGILEGLRAGAVLDAVLAPRPGACCVEIHARAVTPPDR
ncbi:MAG: transcriptional regulator [Jatrophihabitans sp.]|nr:MAG: transcriptional regulator [Jatrophihabitans sp.]